MSTAETSGHDPNSIQQDPKRPEETLVPQLPPDPLLKSGTFIAVPQKGTTAEPPPPPPPQLRRSSDDAVPACLAAEKSNGEAPPVAPAPAPAPGNAASLAETPPRRAPAAAPDWLPAGWMVEDRVRSSGVTAGTVDRYYFDSVSGSRFRSKKEVLYFLETGTKRKTRKPSENSDADTMGSGGQKQKKSATKARTFDLKFDFSNVPEKVQWVLTDFSKGSWAPFTGDKKVPQTTVQEWEAAFTAFSSKNNGQKLF
ncbi:methyl-CpG-binding domain-containing protein 5-like isoform X2 [Quercus lobata]|uniref:methyl-CpG-binding domain-containing protein 5-like isoform X2 n=1 Tax=Quercus lobata TaxID=97700 RepID=UPI001244DC2D|nr:methyl-CpG-binding domain-containing protein 5-like isoform X2 [Quercus lobata]